MSHVLHIIQGLSTGGGGRALLAAAKYSSGSNGFRHRIASLTPAAPQAVKQAGEIGVPVLDVPDHATIEREVAAADFVLVHFWNTPELYALLESDLPPARLIAWVHVAGDRPPQIIPKRLIDHADFVAACSPFTYEHPVFQTLSDAERTEKTAMIFAGSDFERLEGFTPKPHETFNVGYVGTVDFLKMHPNFVRMSAACDIPNVRFVVCGGGGGIRTIQSQIRELNAADRFVLSGPVQDVKSVFETLDVFGYPLCPDTYAAAELVVQEAMFCGVPPVVFPHGGLKRLVGHGETGLIVQSESEYRTALETLHRDADLRIRLGRNAAAFARRRFRVEKSARELDDLFRRLSRLPKRSRRWTVEAVADRPDLHSAFPGAVRFLDSLDGVAPEFVTSLTASDPAELLEAESRIAVASPVMCNPNGGGIFHYRSAYPNDARLRLWSGLALERQGRFALATAEYSKASQLGFDHWRIAWYLARTAEKAGAFELARRSLKRVLAAVPEFNQACLMNRRLNVDPQAVEE